MEFNSLLYIFVFLPIVFGIYWGLIRFSRNSVANGFLIAASIFFYCFVVFWYFIPLLFSSVVDYFCGRRIADSDDEKYRKRLMLTSVVVNLSLMSFFKYSGWISGELAVALSAFGISFSQINVALPPGVSFYTFQTMSYSIDIYRKEFKPKKGFTDYLAFVSFFPQLVAGPIERAKDLLPQLTEKRKFITGAAASSACFLILWGVFQKVALADNFGGLIDFVLMSLGNGDLPAGFGLVFAYAFAFQIYCDFAAYSTIARGTARLFSINLSRNFLTPYFASSPSEFWERWHITLSKWLRDYLYIPLGGNRDGKLLTLRNLVITMILGGLWHGAGVFFIVWGLYHGLLLVLYRLVPIDEFLIGKFGRVGKALSIFIFFHLVCIGWIFFRATPDQFLPIVSSILALPYAIADVFIWAGSGWGELSGATDVALLPAMMVRQFIIDNFHFVVLCWGLVIFGLPVVVTDYLGWRNNGEFIDLFDQMSNLTKTLVTLALVYGILFFGRREANEFIYFAF